MAGSTECNPFAAIAAGTAALWGPSHGGANEAVLDKKSKEKDRLMETYSSYKDLYTPKTAMAYLDYDHLSMEARDAIVNLAMHLNLIPGEVAIEYQGNEKQCRLPGYDQTCEQIRNVGAYRKTSRASTSQTADRRTANGH